MPIHRGYIYWVDFGNPEPDGHEMGFMHPAVVLSLDVINNSKGNFLITVIPGTTKGRLASTHPFLHVVSVKPDPENRLREETFFLGHQIRSIAKAHFDNYIGRMREEHMRRVEEAVRIILRLDVAPIVPPGQP